MCGASIIKNKKQLYTIAVLFSILFVFISTPWEFGLNFYAVSVSAWWIHYIIGTILCVYVMWAFIRAIVILTGHERHHIEGCNG